MIKSLLMTTHLIRFEQTVLYCFSLTPPPPLTPPPSPTPHPSPLPPPSSLFSRIPYKFGGSSYH